MIVAMALIGSAQAVTPAPAPTSAPAAALVPELQPLAFLVGSCWRAAVPDTQATDTHCFTRMLGGHFVRDRHRLDGVAYAGETVYHWDAGARQIRFDYYQSQGLTISGTASSAPNGLAFALGLPSADRMIEFRAIWARDGSDAYVVSQEARDGEIWRPLPQRPRFTRIGPAPAD